MQEYSINQSLNGASVLLTGVTGFVGGSLLERILRLDPGPERIFVLVRHKRGLEARSRLDALLDSPLYEKVEPSSLKKIVVMSGDVTIEGLGLSDHSRDLLLSTCTNVFHSAASISFAAPLDAAVKINLLGTRYVLRMAKRMPNIKSMVHVSTAYVNCTWNSDEHLEERIYPSKYDPVQFTDMIADMSPGEITARTKEFLDDHPNTYTFTKNMAENLLEAERGCIPLSIVRPSIVLNSWKQPMSGWVDNVNNGACGFIAGVGRGIFRTFQARPEARLDIIPVDMVVSTILAASLQASRNPEKLSIYHSTSSLENSTCWSEYCDAIVKHCRSHPCKIVAWYPEAKPRCNRYRNAAVYYVFQYFPSYVINALSQLAHPGQRHIILPVQEKFAKANAYTSFFATRQWSFARRNAVALERTLASDERETHPMNPADLEWDRYFEICVLGLRRYFHREGSTTTERARQQMRRLRIVAAVTPFLTFIAFWYLLVAYLPGFSLSSTSAALIAGFLVLFLLWL